MECSEQAKTKTKTKTKTMAATSTMRMTQETCTNGTETWSHTSGARLNDGSYYRGDLDRFGRRSGKGVWRSPMTMYGAYIQGKAKSMFHWTEYEGEWCNDLPNGQGTMRNCCGDGTNQDVYEGMWQDGNQQVEE